MLIKYGDIGSLTKQWLRPSIEIYTYIVQYRLKEFWRHAKKTNPLEVKIRKINTITKKADLAKLSKQILSQKDELLLLNKDIKQMNKIITGPRLSSAKKILTDIFHNKVLLAKSVSLIIQKLQNPARLTHKGENQETSKVNALWYQNYFTISRSSKPLKYSLALAYHYTRCASIENSEDVSEVVRQIIEQQGGGKISIKNALGSGLKLIKEMSKLTNGTIIDTTEWKLRDRRQKAITRRDGKRKYKITHKNKKHS
ncbi:MAG: hypothetical protein HN353_02735 [Bdellovibrionales bacterium]|nr:hypothetical protein [Bdellovibrionales bacterium]MBT3525603.1 hypothetical protein [Bdellovibrionales bacterium]